MLQSKGVKLVALMVLSLALVAGVYGGMILVSLSGQAAAETPPARAAGGYIVLAWNDLGMHCYNRDFQDLAVLPPYNNLWAQVIKVGDPPEIITSGISITYSFPDNTYSAGKSNFWTYAQALFGLTSPLTPNIGLTGKGLSGMMDLHGDHFTAEGIPLTEYRDSAPTTRYPYQLATIIVRDSVTNLELARTQAVAPVSTEMRCDNCHHDGGVEGIATGKVERNILTLHDQEEGTHLMNQRPVLCANCHASNALGKPGQPNIPNLSKAMHHKHAEEGLPSTLAGCYNCHPGPTTQCLRDVMSQPPTNLVCPDCHGSLATVASNPTPWLKEPICHNCHTDNKYQQDQPLYRMSRGHGGIYCEGCHDSTHAIAPSTQPNDAIKFIALQGHQGTLDTCTVCHASLPTAPGPHGIIMPAQRSFTFAPNHYGVADPGGLLIYTHTLRNTGNVSDTYGLAWSSSQGWAALPPEVTVDGAPVALPGPISLLPNQTALVTVTISVPAVIGLVDTTRITAAWWLTPTQFQVVQDVTLIPRSRTYLPLILRND